MVAPKPLPLETLGEWLSTVSAKLDIDPNGVDIETVLNVAGDVAHEVARPAAPLSTFLLGVAVGRAMAASSAGSSKDPRAELQSHADSICELAADWDRPVRPVHGS